MKKYKGEFLFQVKYRESNSFLVENNETILLSIDYTNKNYSITNESGKDLVFLGTKRTELHLALLTAMKEAIEFAKKELE